MLQHPATTHVANAASLAVCAVSTDHTITILVGVAALIYYATYIWDWVAKKLKKD